MKWLIFLFLLIPVLGFSKPFSITLNQEEKSVVYQIISTMGEKGITRLLFESGKLSRLGGRIQHIHPLQFIGYIVDEPYLNECLHRIVTSYFKWKAFLDGFATSMQKQQQQNLISEGMIREFACYFKVNYHSLWACVRVSDWDAFARVLL